MRHRKTQFACRPIESFSPLYVGVTQTGKHFCVTDTVLVLLKKQIEGINDNEWPPNLFASFLSVVVAVDVMFCDIHFCEFHTSIVH